MPFECTQENMLPCMWKQTLGVDCIGCGLQRSFWLLLEGDLSASISMYPALLPMLCLPILLAVHLVYKLKYGAQIITWWFATTACMMLVNWFLKTVVPLFII